MVWTLLLAGVYFFYGAMFAVGFAPSRSRPWFIRWSLGALLFVLWPLAILVMGFIIAAAFGRIVSEFFSRY